MRDILLVREVTPEYLKQFLESKPEEREWLDYKREVNQKVVETIAAMANTDGGGVILVGVEEEKTVGGKNTEKPGDIVGVQEDDYMRLIHMCRDRLDPARYLPDIRKVWVDGRLVLVIRIDPEGVPVRPVIVREDRVGKVFIRHGASTIQADSWTLRQLFALGFQATLHPSSNRPPLDFLGPDPAPPRPGLLIQAAYQERSYKLPRPLSSMDREDIIEIFRRTPENVKHADILNRFSWTLKESSSDYLRLQGQRIPDSGSVPVPEGLSLWVGWRDRFLWVQMDAWHSGKLSWKHAYTWTLTCLITVCRIPHWISDKLPAGWDPQACLCINPLGSPLTEVIGLPKWQKVHSRYDPSYPPGIIKSIEIEKLDENIPNMVDQFWSGMLYNLGFLHFEEPLRQHSREAIQDVGDFVKRWEETINASAHSAPRGGEEDPANGRAVR